MAIPSDSLKTLPDDEEREIRSVSVTMHGSTAPNGGRHLPSDEYSRSWVYAQILPPATYPQAMPHCNEWDEGGSYTVSVFTDLRADEGLDACKIDLTVDGGPDAWGWVLRPVEDEMGPYELGGARTMAEAFCHGVLAAVAMAGRERRTPDDERAAELAAHLAGEDRVTSTAEECPLCEPTDWAASWDTSPRQSVSVHNVGRDHYAACKTHRVYWPTNAWLASCWRFETREEWIENAALLETYELVEPRVHERECAIA